MIRLREIDDLELREQVRSMIASDRDMPASAIADWWELDDADFSDILIAIRYADQISPDDLDSD